MSVVQLILPWLAAVSSKVVDLEPSAFVVFALEEQPALRVVVAGLECGEALLQ